MQITLQPALCRDSLQPGRLIEYGHRIREPGTAIGAKPDHGIQRLSAQAATRTGLVTEIVPDDQLRSRAGELAAEIADRRPQGIEGTVRAMWEARELPHTTAARHGLSYIPHRQRRRRSPRLTHQQEAPRIR